MGGCEGMGRDRGGWKLVISDACNRAINAT